MAPTLVFLQVPSARAVQAEHKVVEGHQRWAVADGDACTPQRLQCKRHAISCGCARDIDIILAERYGLSQSGKQTRSKTTCQVVIQAQCSVPSRANKARKVALIARCI